MPRDLNPTRSAYCPTHDKEAYASRKLAKKAIREHQARSQGMREYPCDAIDGYYHYGHLPYSVRRGVMTADEWYTGWTPPQKKKPLREQELCTRHRVRKCESTECRDETLERLHRNVT